MAEKKALKIALAHDQPLEDMVIGMIKDLGSLSATAKALGVTQGSVSLWLQKWGYTVKVQKVTTVIKK